MLMYMLLLMHYNDALYCIAQVWQERGPGSSDLGLWYLGSLAKIKRWSSRCNALSCTASYPPGPAWSCRLHDLNDVKNKEEVGEVIKHKDGVVIERRDLSSIV